jgi:CRP/FNR family transcriptional regulator
MTDIDASLRRAELYSSLDDETRAAIARVARKRDVAPDEVVFNEGDPGAYAFIIDAGQFEVIKRADTGADVVLRELRPGNIGGMTSMSVDKSRSATLRAKEGGRLLVIDKADFLALLAERFALAQALIAYLGNKVRTKTRQVATLRAGEAVDPRTQIAFFDAKPYDRRSFDARLPEHLCANYFDWRLTPSTAIVADGFPVVFYN